MGSILFEWNFEKSKEFINGTEKVMYYFVFQ